MISSRALLKKILRKVAFSNLIISFGDSSPMLKSCWIHSKNNNFLAYCSVWWNKLWSETYKTVQNPETAMRRCSAMNFPKFTEIQLSRSHFLNKVASEFWQTFMRQLFYRTLTGDCFWKWKTFFRSKLIIKVIHF